MGITNKTSGCVYKLSIFTQNKLALEPIQDFSPRSGPAMQELSTGINRVFTWYTLLLTNFTYLVQ